MIKALIFDFDGLILDTETAWYEAYRTILQKRCQYNLRIEEFVQCVGTRIEVLYDHLRQVLPEPIDGAELSAAANELHREQVRQLDARPGVRDYLADARKLGLGVALATSSTRDWIEGHLERLGLISYFDFFVTRDDVKQIKPAPDLFCKAMEQLGVRQEEALVFEDSLNGLIAANQAGLKTVIIPNPVTEQLPFTGHHLRLKSMADMPLSEVLQTV